MIPVNKGRKFWRSLFTFCVKESEDLLIVMYAFLTYFMLFSSSLLSLKIWDPLFSGKLYVGSFYEMLLNIYIHTYYAFVRNFIQ